MTTPDTSTLVSPFEKTLAKDKSPFKSKYMSENATPMNTTAYYSS